MIFISMISPTDDPRVVFSDEGGGSFSLDVRELLLDSGQPYAPIMSCVQQLNPGEILNIHAIFEPVPLIRKLSRQGYAVASEHRGVDHWVLAVRRS